MYLTLSYNDLKFRVWDNNYIYTNLIQPTRPKMAEDLIPSRLWASLYARCNTLAYDKGHAHQHLDSSEADHYQGLHTQLCSTLCNQMDCCPPGSSLHGIFQARILERVAMPSSRGSSWPRDQTWVSWVSCISWRILLPLLLLLLSRFSRVRLYATPWTVAHQAPLSTGSGVPCPSSDDLPGRRIEPESFTFPALAGRFFTTSTTWEVKKGQKVGGSLTPGKLCSFPEIVGIIIPLISLWNHPAH